MTHNMLTVNRARRTQRKPNLLFFRFLVASGYFLTAKSAPRDTTVRTRRQQSLPEEWGLFFPLGNSQFLCHTQGTIIWATALAVAWLEIMYPEAKEEWQLLIDKATRCMKRKLEVLQDGEKELFLGEDSASMLRNVLSAASESIRSLLVRPNSQRPTRH